MCLEPSGYCATGHADTATTLRIYAEALKYSDKQIVDMQDNILKQYIRWHENGTNYKEIENLQK